VEIGVRPHGGHGARVGELAIHGRGQINLLADALTDPAELHRKTASAYRVDRHSWQVFLTCDRSGTLTRVRHLEMIESLSSFQEIVLKVSEGGLVEVTHDHWSMPGFVVLSHPERAVVERDYAVVRRLNSAGMFEVV